MRKHSEADESALIARVGELQEAPTRDPLAAEWGRARFLAEARAVAGINPAGRVTRWIEKYKTKEVWVMNRRLSIRSGLVTVLLVAGLLAATVATANAAQLARAVSGALGRFTSLISAPAESVPAESQESDLQPPEPSNPGVEDEADDDDFGADEAEDSEDCLTEEAEDDEVEDLDEVEDEDLDGGEVEDLDEADDDLDEADDEDLEDAEEDGADIDDEDADDEEDVDDAEDVDVVEPEANC